MSFIKTTKELLNETLTENGDKAYNSTLSFTLDYFSLVGGKRNRVSDCVPLFVRALSEDRNTALKLLFYTRDIRGGLGERRIFRFLFNSLACTYPEIAIKLIPYIPEYGRYDDLLCALDTPLYNAVLDYISRQLNEDIKHKSNGEPISLLAKWLPSINTSNEDARHLALDIAEGLKMSKAEYRKTLSFLRKGIIVENNLREKQYDFDYQKVPSAAMHKYRNAFSINDQERFNEYIRAVGRGEAKMNTAVLDVVTFVTNASMKPESRENKEYFTVTWDKLVEEAKINKRTLVVRDGSGSMYTYERPAPIEVANALTLLTASRLEGEFKDCFITFSSRPQLVDLSNCKDIFEKLDLLTTYDDISNTNIQKVYELILNVYKSPDFKESDALDQIMIISDMQFDRCISPHGLEDDFDNLKSTFEYFKEQFSLLGYKMPEIVYWFVNSRANNVPVTKNEMGVKLVSGSNKNIISLVTDTVSIDPMDFMNKVLKKYSFIDELFKDE